MRLLSSVSSIRTFFPHPALLAAFLLSCPSVTAALASTDTFADPTRTNELAAPAAEPTATNLPAKLAIAPHSQRASDPCPIDEVAIDWNFAEGDHGFVSVDCDNSGVQVWEHGPSGYVPDTPAQVWATVLEGDYPNDAGAGLLSPPFWISEQSRYVEIFHYFDIESDFDGCNVSVGTWPNSQVLTPLSGYTVTEISPNASYYAWCVDGDPGWTSSAGSWRVDCFDLSEYLGQEITLELDFGSDISVTGPGWYLGRITVGGEAPATGACCDSNAGECVIVFEEVCLEMGGNWDSQWTACDPDPCAPLAPPSNVLAETQSETEILVSWEDNEFREEGFTIERKEGANGDWELVQVVPANFTTWPDPTVSEDELYYYRVRALGVEDLSAISNYAQTIAGAIPATPDNLIAWSISPVRVDLTWWDQASNEYGFEVERKEGEFGNWLRLTPNPPTNSTYWPNVGVQSDTEYTFRIRAYNLYGKSDWFQSEPVQSPPDPGSFDAAIQVLHGTQPASGATVEINRGNGWTYLGSVDQAGYLSATNLELNAQLRATWAPVFWLNCRYYRLFAPNTDMGESLYLDSDVMDSNGFYDPVVITSVETDYEMKVEHTIFKFDLGISVEWDIPAGDAYWDELELGMQRASDFLYNATDGQVALRRIAIWDNKAHWKTADVHIENSVWPHADTGQFNDCDAWSGEEHFYVPRIWGGNLPSGRNWFRVFTHEFGHYALNLKDEYETPSGGQAQMDNLKRNFPQAYPANYGIMDNQGSSSEMSSKNDYLQNYDYGCNFITCPIVQSEQLHVRGRSCWDQLESDLEGKSGLANIIKPQPAWYAGRNSSSTDRIGPVTGLSVLSVDPTNVGNVTGPPVQVEFHDEGPGSFEAELVVSSPAGPAMNARVYAVANEATGSVPGESSKPRLLYLGETDPNGKIDMVGLEPGDEIRVYERSSRGVRQGRVDNVQSSIQGQLVELAMAGEGVGPGVSLESMPIGTVASPGIELSIWPDEPLASDPELLAHHSEGIEVLSVEYVPAESRYRAEVYVDLESGLFDGTGIFEITLEEAEGAIVSFMAPFTLGRVDPNEFFEGYQDLAEFNVSSENLFTVQLVSTLSTNALPFRDEDLSLTPVSDIYSFHLAEDDILDGVASLNVGYVDSLLAGVDEESLDLFQWSASGMTWIPVDGAEIGPISNVVSAPMTSGGVYCVFALSTSNDIESPSPVLDFGAVGVEGDGAVELLWSAPGDDGMVGAAREYIVAYHDAEITDANWDQLPQISLPQIPMPAGSQESALIRVPEAGTLYNLALRSKDEASNLSPLSNPTYTVSGSGDANYLPAAPLEVRAVDRPGDNGEAARLSWNLSYDDGGGKESVVEYRLYRSPFDEAAPEFLAAVPAGTASYDDTSAELGAEYLYWVSASDGNDERFGIENRALVVQNQGTPVGDYTADGIVGIDDFGHFVNGYGIDLVDLEFDPVFDHHEDGEVSELDAFFFGAQFGIGGTPTSDPEGENSQVEVFQEIVVGEGELWYLNLTASNASNLAGYSFRVDLPEGTFPLGGSPDSTGAAENLLTIDGGHAPVFLLGEETPGEWHIAYVLERPSETSAPEGAGFLAHLSFVGGDPSEVNVSDITFLDAFGGINSVAATSSVHDATSPDRPFLYWSSPSPFRNETAIRFQIPETSDVELSIYDVSGRRVRTLAEGAWAPGMHTVNWDGRSDSATPVASGVYFYRFEVGKYRQARKVVRVR